MNNFSEQSISRQGYVQSSHQEPDESKSEDTFQFEQTTSNQIPFFSFGNLHFKRSKIFQYIFIIFLVVGYTIIWFQDFQTYSKHPVSKPGLEVKTMPEKLLIQDEFNGNSDMSIQVVPSQKTSPTYPKNATSNPAEPTPQQKQEEAKHQKQIQQEQKKRQHEQEMRRQCYKKDILYRYVFFLSFDIDELPKEQKQQFLNMNWYCGFEVNNQLAFDYFVDLWNQREEELRFDQDFINKKDFNKEEKRMLFIWLKLYFWAGIYIHPSLGVNFGQYINDRYLLNAQVGKEITFAKYDHQNQKGIYVPQRNFKTVKVGSRFSEYVRKIIKNIIAKKDWMEVCENYQCIIIKDAINLPQKA